MGWVGWENTYSELPTSPYSFHNAKLVECQDGEEYFCRVCETQLLFCVSIHYIQSIRLLFLSSSLKREQTYRPNPNPPKLPILPQMRHNLDMQIESRIRNRGEQRANDGAEDEELRYGRVGEA